MIPTKIIFMDDKEEVVTEPHMSRSDARTGMFHILTNNGDTSWPLVNIRKIERLDRDCKHKNVNAIFDKGERKTMHGCPLSICLDCGAEIMEVQ